MGESEKFDHINYRRPVDFVNYPSTILNSGVMISRFADFSYVNPEIFLYFLFL